MKKKVLYLILVLAVCLAAGGLVYHFKSNKPVAAEEVRPTVEAQRPQMGDITLYTDLIGTIEPEEVVSAMPKMAGEVLEIYFSVGDYVTAGQPLCRIDSDALTALKIQADSARVAMDDAARALSRTQALFAQGVVSQQALEQAQSAASSTSLQYQAARNSYDLQVKYTTVTAPIDGTVESRDIDLHDVVSPSTAVCVISAKDQITVKFGVPEKVMRHMETGMEVSLDKNGGGYRGSVIEVASMADSATGLYQVKAAVAEGQSLATGSRVKLSVMMDQAKGVMTIPVNAVSYDNGTPFVYCYEDGIARKTVIESGIYDMERMEVVSGLNAESLVVTTWSNELSDGAEVLLKERNEEQESGSAEVRGKAGDIPAEADGAGVPAASQPDSQPDSSQTAGASPITDKSRDMGE